MIRLASKVAQKSEFSRARVGAVICRGSRVLATGCNYIGYCREIPDRPFPESVHAEAAAIAQLLKARRLAELVGSTLFVSRVNRAGNPRLARPCRSCEDLIKSVGIKKVIYTTNEGVGEL